MGWPGGVLRFGLDGDGAPFKPQNPLPIFKGHFGRKRYTEMFWIFWKMNAIFRDILVESGTHV